MNDFHALKKNLKKDFTGLRTIKVALLGDTATQFLAQAIRGYGYDAHVHIELLECGYDQIDRHIVDSGSELYAFSPEFVIIYLSAGKLKDTFISLPLNQRAGLADSVLKRIGFLHTQLCARSSCKIILYNFLEHDDSVFGNFANSVQASFTYQIRKLNYEIMNLSMQKGNLFICDILSLQIRYGTDHTIDHRMRITADMEIGIDLLPFVSKNTIDIIMAVCGRMRKCLILDLDNTLWGGIIGETGMENIEIGHLGIGRTFSEFQHWCRQLRQRGVLLAVCSKNDEQTAREPFEKHPDMVLRMEDFAVFLANWENKADNIKKIQSLLNIGFDSMVFLDDSPFERNLVRTALPEVIVPELPTDPVEYLRYISSQNLFETASVTQEDELRTQQYRQEAHRIEMRQSYFNEDDYLRSLHMECEACAFDRMTIPRVAQLTQRSNQFNLRTIRYTEEQIQAICADDTFFTAAFSLADSFGDYGLISAVILKKQTNCFFIDTWVMSCRVLKRGVEHFVLNHIAHHAASAGLSVITGEYIATSKNSLVANLFENLGFTKNGNVWTLDIANYQPHSCHIRVKQCTPNPSQKETLHGDD